MACGCNRSAQKPKRRSIDRRFNEAASVAATPPDADADSPMAPAASVAVEVPSERMRESDQKILQVLEQINPDTRHSNVYLEDLSLRNAEAALAALNPAPTFDDDRWKLRLQIAQGASRLGEEELAIGLFETS
jgi:hypothetical protein